MQKIQGCSTTSSCILHFASQHALLAILIHSHLRSGRHTYITVCCVNINYTERAQTFSCSLAEMTETAMTDESKYIPVHQSLSVVYFIHNLIKKVILTIRKKKKKSRIQ